MRAGALRWLAAAALTLVSLAGPGFADRLKDLVDIAGVRTNPLVGYGLVVGLVGTGDGTSGLTQQSIQSIISRLGLETEASSLDA